MKTYSVDVTVTVPSTRTERKLVQADYAEQALMNAEGVAFKEYPNAIDVRVRLVPDDEVVQEHGAPKDSGIQPDES